jgi:hypothetical protein
VSEIKAREMWNLRRPTADLLAACEEARDWAIEIHEWCATGKAAQQNIRELIQTDAAMIVEGTTGVIAKVRSEE